MCANDSRTFRRVMGLFATGVTVITTEHEERIHGMTANAFMAGSLDPPLCVVSVGNRARISATLRAAGRYGVSFLSQHQRHLSHHFAGQPVPGCVPEFARLADTPVLAHAVGMVAADVVQAEPCGDHTLFIGRITRMEAGDADEPLLFYGGRYGRVDRDSPIERIDPPSFW